MSYKIVPTPNFQKEFKRLFKKYPSLKDEIAALEETISEQPQIGVSIGNNCYKIRIAIKSKGKGKSGGGRIITHIFVEQTKVFLLSIYDKSESENISEHELLQLLALIEEQP